MEPVAFLMCQVRLSLSLAFHKPASCTRPTEENCLEPPQFCEFSSDVVREVKMMDDTS